MTRVEEYEEGEVVPANETDLLLPVDADCDPESAPLLVHGHAHRKVTPLPLAQLLILAAVRLAEPISFTQVFPYVNQMIEELGIAAPADVGYYSGMVDSMFSIAQLFTIYFWSSLSDRIGRKPVIMIGLTGATLSAACFGFSRSLSTMLIARALAGGLSGNVAVVSSMLSEMTDETNQGMAFPLIGATWSIGCIIGPIIGGNLSRPATRWPDIFGQFQLLRDYPYALPCLISASLSVFAIVLCGIFVEETLPSIVAAKAAKTQSSNNNNKLIDSPSGPSTYGATWDSNASTPHGTSGASTPTLTSSEELTFDAPTPTSSRSASEDAGKKEIEAESGGVIWNLLKQPHVRAVLGSGFMLSFIGVGYEVVFVLYSYTRIDLGGMGRSPVQIGYALAGSGVVGTITSLLVFPYIQRRFNNRRMYAFFSAFWPLGFALMPLGNAVARLPPSGNEDKRDAVAWLAIIVILIPIRVAVNVYPLNMIIVKSSVDRSEQLGSMFGLQQTCSSIARGMAPAFVSAIFALSVERQVLGGNFVWLVLFLVALTAVPLAWGVRDVPAPGVHHVAGQVKAKSPERGTKKAAAVGRS